ncbi:hypothetical protein D0T51_00800 [Parabacteroides sp. 52]|uniref:hypothetical protein n=1 Tax=unclassified Parabacteroides TaxID=2649774 RepID=UPI0013D8CDCA|nr:MULTISPECIES: hypothetical protein [unclassified Parabacteroides]MDH6533522.1 hypothetical protein [Parabacteroides sp. PM5-20]NDV54275.1 hypothetical protein [Parabacteroides sp. 52]
MNKDLLHENVLQAIKERMPNKMNLANRLVDLLCIEKEAVYRRLRGEVAFTFSEIALISNEFGISLDNIISSSLSLKSKPFQLKAIDYLQPEEMDYAMMEQYLGIMKAGRMDPRSEIVDCTNTLPLYFYHGHKYLERLQLFKSLYQSGRTNTVKSFEEIHLTKRLEQYQKEDVIEIKYIKNAYYIFDPFIFQYLVNDVIYFRSINLISEEDMENMKNDLLHLLSEMEQLAISGFDKDTGNRIYMYVASINFDVSCWYIDINNYHISMLKAFVLNNFTSLDEDSFLILKKRIEALLRSSTMISVSGERQRIAFFEKQREIVNTLNVLSA